jgi:DNA uptake protein ComE-like DNA-binding protein
MIPTVRAAVILPAMIAVVAALSACSEPVEQAEIAETLPPPPEELVFDLNTVTLEELLDAVRKIDGLNAAIARNIIEFREKVGFEHIEDLLAIPEIGEATYLKIRRHFKVSVKAKGTD